MKVLVQGVLLVAALSICGCGTAMRPNPEYGACTSACVEKKNACMLTATTGDAITACEAGHRTCVEPCASIPRSVPVK